MTLPVEGLEALIKDLRWEHFEADPLGQIQVDGKLFCMRVGLHMDRPVQAIVCDGQFVRIRSAEFYQDKQLLKIDPERLAESLYMEGIQAGGPWPKWRPLMPDPSKLIGASQANNPANQVKGYATYGGGSGGGHASVGGGRSAGGIGKYDPSLLQAVKDQLKMKMQAEMAKLELERELANKGEPWFLKDQ
ncbi:MAG: hypothetical protein EHM40_23145 [Chloroflexi bacterium]|nr:MAG: hypothetical protein EHM40_23145 [Chloroflexota bacterium]